MHHAELIRTASSEEAFALLVAGQAEALGTGNRQTLLQFADRLPGSRVLDDRFGVVEFTLAVPKSREAGLAFLAAFLEEAKASGFLAASLERSGTRGVSVAPLAESTGAAQSVADFYRGKALTIIVSNPPGGGSDTTARVLAGHIGNHIPGSPTVFVENMPGAAGLVGANHLYNVTEPDGLTIGTFNEGLVGNQAIAGHGIQFDARHFGWLGSVQRSSRA